MRTRLTVLLLLALAALTANTAIAADNVHSGEIMDSQCAMMGSHDSMMKGMGAKNAKECTQQCVQMGGKYVLYDAAQKTTYQLDDQKKSAAFAGQKVKVTGDLKGKTIHVQKIEPAT